MNVKLDNEGNVRKKLHWREIRKYILVVFFLGLCLSVYFRYFTCMKYKINKVQCVG